MTQQQEHQPVITDEMREAVGKEGEPMTLEVEKTGCRMFARAVGHTDLIFYDEEYAKSKGHRSIVAPPGFLGTPVYNPRGSRVAGEGAAFRFNIPYKRILNGGTEVEYVDTVYAGDVLTATTKLTGFTERVGSVGPMLITSRETTYTNQEGRVVARMRGSAIQY